MERRRVLLWLTESEFGEVSRGDDEERVKRAAEILGVSVIELFQILRRFGSPDIVGRRSAFVMRRLQEAALG